MSSNYFNGLMRSAGMALKASPPAPSEPMAAPGGGEVFDPFEAAETVEAVAPVAPVSPAPIEALNQARDQAHAVPDASVPAPKKEALPAALARDAHPAVQAALRWVTAAESSAREAAIPGNSPVIAAMASSDPKPAPTQEQAHRASPPATTRVEHITAQLSGPHGPMAAPVPEFPMEGQETAAPQPLAPSKSRAEAFPVTASPARSRPADPPERGPNTSARAEVRIGTLHVTLDDAATARFATRTIAPPAPEPARSSPANTVRPSSRPGAGSSGSLSRSRLPRW